VESERGRERSAARGLAAWAMPAALARKSDAAGGTRLLDAWAPSDASALDRTSRC
jgi:hypothetical protein